MSFLVARGCSTAAGPGVPAFMRALNTSSIPVRDGAFRFPEPGGSIRELLGREILRSVEEMCRDAGESAWERLRSQKIGVILASTKGCGWDSLNSEEGAGERDSVTPLLEDLLQQLEIPDARAIGISNACSSGLAALRLAQTWLKQGIDDVLVVAADAVTPFVQRGFGSLKLLAQRQPEEGQMNGFLLGEATASVWLSSQGSPIRLRQVGLDSEPSLVTRPETSSASLKRAILQIPEVLTSGPDWVLHHGTGTVANSETEDRVFRELFPSLPRSGSKHRIGHTLGASALIDLIRAMEALREGSSRRILLTSLGFGGMQAAALLEAT